MDVAPARAGGRRAAFGGDVGIVVRLWSIWVAFLILAGGWLGDIRMMGRVRVRRLASIGFSPGGVPVEWLPPPPEPPEALPSP